MPEYALAQFRKLWLITVAVGRYANRDLMPDLPETLADATRLRAVRRDKGDAPIAHTLELFNEQATRAAILEVIASVARDAHEPDLIVLLFAGHGIDEPRRLRAGTGKGTIGALPS
jgi:uncharacterized caspase-like protein